MTKADYTAWLAERYVQMYALKTGTTMDAAVQKSMVEAGFKLAEVFITECEKRAHKPWERME